MPQKDPPHIPLPLLWSSAIDRVALLPVHYHHLLRCRDCADTLVLALRHREDALRGVVGRLQMLRN
jgi:hypothetical protein